MKTDNQSTVCKVFVNVLTIGFLKAMLKLMAL